MSASEYTSEVSPTWCPGCGDFAVLRAIQSALAELDMKPHEVVVVSGIGCSSNLPHFLRSYGFHTIHGRACAVATGVKLANPDLHVIVTGGDGDGYGIGLGHFLHACRRNVNMTYVNMNNQIYGLTTGQTSPTSLEGHETKSTPAGNHEYPLNPPALALAAGASYVARGFSGDPKGLGELVKGGLEHEGFAHVDTFSPCVTFNKLNTYAWFKERIENLDDEGHDPTDRAAAAVKAATAWGDPDQKLPIGLFYRNERPTYESQEAAYQKANPAKDVEGLSNVHSLLKKLM